VNADSAPFWRLATAKDDDAIALMVMALNSEDPGDEPVPPDHARRTLETLRREPVRGLVAVLDEGGEPRGYAFLISFWSNELGGETCEIDELYVAPHLRGRGLGSTLVMSLKDGTGPWPRVPVALSLQVTPDNQRARQLYRRLGFSDWKNMMMIIRLRPRR
jgi:ribosomal protein S18 acetylase RimI-like enzyme